MPTFQNKIVYPTLITWTSPDGKLHVPPDPPLVKGYPPWFPRPNEYRRRPPLKKCPDTKCRRAGKCVSLLYGEFCQKTHMMADDFRAALANKIDRLMREKLGADWDKPDADEPYDPCPTPHPDIKRDLEKAQAEKEHQELLNWQTQWIEKVKREYATSLPRPGKAGTGGVRRSREGVLPPTALKESRRGHAITPR